MKKLIQSLIFVFLSTMIFANPVSQENAKLAGINYFNHYSVSPKTIASISDVIVTKNGSVASFYTFIFIPVGFVIVSADDAVTPILGYSTTEVFDKNNIPENAVYFLDQYNQEINEIVTTHLSNAITSEKWAHMLSNNFTKDPMAPPVTPMCVTTWDQGSPYNNLCPSGVPTGCVATTMAQIMKKWNYPTMGVGSHTYTHATYGVQTANYGATTYQWASMINSYSGASTAAQKTAVATLMYHCGVGVDMNYAPAGSGAYSGSIPPALINYFSYQVGCEVKTRSVYPTDFLWKEMIKAEMDQGRPCTLAGQDVAAGGHEWVCDGYNASSLFHMNWGWGGSSNGYFQLTNLNPTGYAFNNGREAVIRIRPASAIIPIANFSADNTIPAIAAPVNFTDLSVNSPTSWLWTFDGGTPATSTLQNPTGVTFATNGYHLVSLTATNINGSDIKTKERYIKVGGAPTVWTKQNSGFAASSRGVDEIDIIDANTAWAKAYDGLNPAGWIREFTRTNNGGATWTPGFITFPSSSNYGVSNIFAVNYLTAYACMFPVTGTGGAIVKTTDGGSTWAVQTGATFVNSWADMVHFFDANNGVCMGDPAAAGTDFFIYTTSNGGATWTQVPLANIPNSLTGEASIVNEYSAVGNTVWFSSTKGRIFKSTNMGVNWTVATTGFTGSYQPHFKDANVGIIVQDTMPYAMRKSIDGGATWSALNSTGYVVKRPHLAFVPGSGSVWFDVASFPSNGSSRSIDDGATFGNIDTGSVQFLSVSFLDANTGWAGSFNLSASNDGIYKWDPAVTTGVAAPNSSYGLDGISMFPNPTKDILNFQLGKIEDENMTITIYNMLGAIVTTQKVRTVSNDILQIDISNNTAGVYFVTIVNGGKSVTKKITIVK